MKASDLFCPKCPSPTRNTDRVCSKIDYREELMQGAFIAGAAVGALANFLPKSIRQCLAFPIVFLIEWFESEGGIPNAPLPYEGGFERVQADRILRNLNYAVDDLGVFWNLARFVGVASVGGIISNVAMNVTLEHQYFCPKNPSCDVDLKEGVKGYAFTYGPIGTLLGGALGLIHSFVPALINSVGNQLNLGGLGQSNIIIKNMIYYPVLGTLASSAIGGVAGLTISLANVYFCN